MRPATTQQAAARLAAEIDSALGAAMENGLTPEELLQELAKAAANTWALTHPQTKESLVD